MYLSKVELRLSNPGIRAAMRDYQKMHQLVNGFFNVGRKEAEILYRVRARGNTIDLYLYSAVPVDQTRILRDMRLIGQRDVTSWLESMGKGDLFEFQIATAPFKKVSSGSLKNSQRRSLKTQDERLAWLVRKAKQGGFHIISVDERPAEQLTVIHQEEKGGKMIMDPYCYTGILQIINADSFRSAMRQGVGPGKAYGLGMIMLKRVGYV